MANLCINFLSLNVRGIRDLAKRKSIISWAKKKKADIIFLQETYSTADVINSWKYQWPGDMCYSHATNHSKGVLVLVNKSLQFELEKVIKYRNWVDGSKPFTVKYFRRFYIVKFEISI